MAFLIQLATLPLGMYPESFNEIARDDDSTLQAKIDAGIDEAKSYLYRYDTDSLFGTAYTDPSPLDANLREKTLDLVRWHLLSLGVDNVDYENARIRYDAALENYFMPIMRGQLAPANWPYRPEPPGPTPEGDTVTYSSNRRRQTHF